MKTIILFVCFFGLSFAALFAKPQSENSSASAEAPLRVGIMLDADSLPLMLARDKGFFDQEGIRAELPVFSGALERDAAVQAGRLDGAVSDLLAAAFLAAGGYDFKVTSLTDGRYGIAASPQSGINSLSQLAGKRAGISVNTIIQYVADVQLEAAGIQADKYEAVAVPGMSLRLEMLLSGETEAACLPEPLLTAAAARGAAILSTTDTAGIDAGVLLFSKKTLDSRLDSVKAFYRAYHKASSMINENPGAYRSYLVENAGFPPEIKDAYRFVTYRKPSLPEDGQIRRALLWLKEKKLLDAELTPAVITDPRAIPEW